MQYISGCKINKSFNPLRIGPSVTEQLSVNAALSGRIVTWGQAAHIAKPN